MMDTMNGLVVLLFSHGVDDLFADNVGVHGDQFFRVGRVGVAFSEVEIFILVDGTNTLKDLRP